MPRGQPLAVPEDGLTTRQRRRAPVLAVHTGDGKGKSVRTSVQTLADGARDEEVARMLAGATITAEARAAAKRLIAEVG